MGIFTKLDNEAGFQTGRPLAQALRTIMANFGLLEPAIVTDAATDHTLGKNDRYVYRTKGTAQTTTVPPNSAVALPIGHQCIVIQGGAGANTIVAGAGVTINHLASKSLVTVAQFGVVRLVQVAANVWNASGDLT